MDPGADPGPQRHARRALVVVDVAASAAADLQSGKIENGVKVLGNLQALVSAARRAEVPTFWTLGGKRWHTSPGADLPDPVRGAWVWKHGVGRDETPAQARLHVTFAPELAPRPEEPVVLKHRPSAFFGTNLAAMLNAARVEQVMIAGVMTSGCIRATVVDAFSYDLRPIVACDAVADVNARWHENGLEEIGRKYAVLAETAALIDADGADRASSMSA